MPNGIRWIPNEEIQPKSFYPNTGTTPCLLMSSTSPNTASRSVSCPYLD